MFEDRGGAGGGHPVLDAARQVHAALQPVLSSAATSLTLSEVQGAATELQAVAAELDAVRLHVVRLLLEREDPSARPGDQTVAWMTHTMRTGRGRARADVAAARATDQVSGELPGLGQALAGGAVSRAHVDTAVRTLRLLPTGMVRERGAEVGELLTSHARSFSPADARELAKHLVKTVSPGAPDAFDDEAHERRFLSVHPDSTGVVQLQGQLDAVGGAVVATVLDRLASPDRVLPSPDGAEPAPVGTADLRTRAQRLADAAVEMAHLAAAQLRLAAPALEPARVVVHCTEQQLAHPDPAEPCATGDDAVTHLAPGPATSELTGLISASSLQRHACDAVLERVVLDRSGAVLRMESLGRLASRAQRRALAARDGGCAWPGCSAPPSWTEAHHVVWWSRGGTTVLENLVLLCPRHHTEVHREHWVVTMRDGVPWFTPPAWVDPDQVPLRNSLHQAIRATRRAGQRLVARQPLDDGSPPSAA